MNTSLLDYNKERNKGVLFFSAASVHDVEQLLDFGVNEILVSYAYIRKFKTRFVDLMQRIYDNKGVLMIDSGAFTFRMAFNGGKTIKEIENLRDAQTYIPYLEEFCEFLHDNAKYFFSTANMDMDNLVGREQVDKWNEKYFLPLERNIQVIYNTIKDTTGRYADKRGIKRLKEYLSIHDYVGVNQTMANDSLMVYQQMQKFKKRIHGFAWTSIPTLKKHPFFSCDSSTWLGGVRYGTSYRFDGKNFKVEDYKHKYKRKIDKHLCYVWGINYEKILEDDRVEVNKYNLVGWMGARQEYLRSANTKLKNKNVSFYDKRPKK